MSKIFKIFAYSIRSFAFYFFLLFCFVYTLAIFQPDKQQDFYAPLLVLIPLAAALSGLSFRASSGTMNQDYRKKYYIVGLKLMYGTLCFCLLVGMRFIATQVPAVLMTFKGLEKIIWLKAMIQIPAVFIAFLALLLGIVGVTAGLWDLTKMLLTKNAQFDKHYSQ